MKSVLIGVGAVVALGICVGAWLAIGGDPAQQQVENKERAWEKFVLAQELVGQDFMTWPGKLECDAWHRWGAFTREKEFLVSDEMVVYDNGDVQEFINSTQGGTVIPAQLSARFEWWRGDVSGTDVVMQGWYTAVNDDLKRLSMSGKLADGVLYLEGERGPRTCRITATRPE